MISPESLEVSIHASTGNSVRNIWISGTLRFTPQRSQGGEHINLLQVGFLVYSWWVSLLTV